MKIIVFLFMISIMGAVHSIAFKSSHSSTKSISDKKVLDLLDEAGFQMPEHYIKDLDSSKVRQGEDLVTIGYTRKDRINTKRISKHFVCINCHNVVRESNQLESSDPEIRFDYMMENKLPFLPASTLYGAVNRTQFFNGDYEKKYGSRAKEAKNNLRKSIQLCAEISSEGRVLEAWEEEAILHYLNSIQLSVLDLNLNKEEIQKLNTGSNKEKISLLQSKFSKENKATFGFPLAANVREKGKTGDWKRGQYIYKFGCMHCHNPEGITIFTLEDDQLNRNFLRNRMDKTNKKSIYEITRTGTQPKKVKKTYMPLYTYEKLTQKQLEDLAAYLNHKPN